MYTMLEINETNDGKVTKEYKEAMRYTLRLMENKIQKLGGLKQFHEAMSEQGFYVNYETLSSLRSKKIHKVPGILKQILEFLQYEEVVVLNKTFISFRKKKIKRKNL